MGRIQPLSGLSTGEPFSFQLLNCLGTTMEKNGWLHISSSRRIEFAKPSNKHVYMHSHYYHK